MADKCLVAVGRCGPRPPPLRQPPGGVVPPGHWKPSVRSMSGTRQLTSLSCERRTVVGRVCVGRLSGGVGKLLVGCWEVVGGMSDVVRYTSAALSCQFETDVRRKDYCWIDVGLSCGGGRTVVRWMSNWCQVMVDQ